MNAAFEDCTILNAMMEIYEMILTEKHLSKKAMEIHHRLKEMISTGTQYSDIIERGLAVIRSQ